LAERVGTHFSYIGGIERGERNVTVKTLENIAECLGIEVFEFFTNLHHDEGAERTELLHQITAILETFGVNGLVTARNILKELTKSQRPDEQ
jgi:transcriptional regulator with XRE-family HTH domain